MITLSGRGPNCSCSTAFPPSDTAAKGPGFPHRITGSSSQTVHGASKFAAPPVGDLVLLNHPWSFAKSCASAWSCAVYLMEPYGSMEAVLLIHVRVCFLLISSTTVHADIRRTFTSCDIRLFHTTAFPRASQFFSLPPVLLPLPSQVAWPFHFCWRPVGSRSRTCLAQGKWLGNVYQVTWFKSLQTGFCGPKEFHTVSNLEWSSPIGWFPTEKKLPKPLVLRASKPQILTQFEIARQLRCSCLQIWNSQIPSCCPKIFRCAWFPHSEIHMFGVSPS